MGDKKGRGVINLQKWVTSFMDGPLMLTATLGDYESFLVNFPRCRLDFSTWVPPSSKTFEKKTYVDGPKLYCQLAFRVDAKH